MAHRETWFEPNIWPSRTTGFQQNGSAPTIARWRASPKPSCASSRWRSECPKNSSPTRSTATSQPCASTTMPRRRALPLPGQLRAGAHSRLRQPHDPSGDGRRRRPAGARQRRALMRCRACARYLHRQPGRPHGAVDQRPLGLHAAPGDQSAAGSEGRQPAARRSPSSTSRTRTTGTSASRPAGARTIRRATRPRPPALTCWRRPRKRPERPLPTRAIPRETETLNIGAE